MTQRARERGASQRMRLRLRRRSTAWRRLSLLDDTSPRHSAPPRYASEKSVRDSFDSVLTGTFDGRSLRAPPSLSPATEHSVSNSGIRAPAPEGISLRAITVSFGSESGVDEDPLSQVGCRESSKARNSRSDCSETDMMAVHYAMRRQAVHSLSWSIGMTPCFPPPNEGTYLFRFNSCRLSARTYRAPASLINSCNRRPF